MATTQIAGLGSAGLFMINGPPSFNDFDKFPRIPFGQLRTFAFNHNGTVIAWADGTGVQVVSVADGVLKLTLNAPKASALRFSPLGNFLATWQTYTTANSQGNPECNLHIWEVQTGKCVKSFHQKRQAGWEPQWSEDEKIVARNVNNEVHFYEDNNYEVIVKKIFLQKISEFSLSTGRAPYHAMCYVQGAKGQPSSIRLYEYPNFEGNSAVKAMKSFFKADQVSMQWNKKGSACLALTVTDVDKSGASYYGEQKLYLLNTAGDSMYVQLAKDGPIYSFEWSPLSNEFCVVYGYMPAKATLYNLKGDSTFDFGTSPRNLVYYNPFGNMLILAGFGNLNGHLEIWDIPKKKEIVRTNARDTTYLQWSPDGEHILTATLSPRLRVGNGYRIWHYSGSLIHEKFCQSDEELRQIHWRSVLPGAFTEKVIKYSSVPSIASAQPQASKEAYRPPGARGLPNLLSKLQDDYEKPSNAKSSEAATKNALKNRKRRAKKAESLAAGESQLPAQTKDASAQITRDQSKKENDKVSGGNQAPPAATKSQVPAAKEGQNKNQKVPGENKPPSSTKNQVDAGKSQTKNQNKGAANKEPLQPREAEKQAGDGQKNVTGILEKRLREIQVLKERQAKGDKLAFSQIEKIGRENEIKETLNKQLQSKST